MHGHRKDFSLIFPTQKTTFFAKIKKFGEGQSPPAPFWRQWMQGTMQETVNSWKQTEIPGVLCTVGVTIFSLLTAETKIERLRCSNMASTSIYTGFKEKKSLKCSLFKPQETNITSTLLKNQQVLRSRNF